MEESILPRLYREAPVNSIWEGSGNVQCLDVLRALSREPAVRDVYLTEIKAAQGADRRLDRAIADLENECGNNHDPEYNARWVVEKMALALQASLLLRAGNSMLADAFCASRLNGDRGVVYGTLPWGVDCKRLIERAWPALG